MQYRKSIVVVFIALIVVALASVPLYRGGPVAQAEGPAATFANVLTIPAHQRPNSIATGDFNEDGRVDMAVTNLNSNDISILLADANGGFGAPNNYRLAPDIFVFPQSIAVADFNGDRHFDFAVVGSLNSEGNAFVRLGNGDGTFRDPTRFFTGNVAVFVVIADFNTDGKADLAVANQGGDFLQGEGRVVHFSATVSVLAGDDAGAFAAPQFVMSYASPKVPTALSVADFNNDGLPDLAVTSNNSKVSGGDPAVDSLTILLNQKPNGLVIVHEIALSNGPGSITSQDVDSDGEIDLAVTGKGSDTVLVLLGNGEGDFGAPMTFPAGGTDTAIAAGDFNGDGNVDLSTTGLRLWILFGGGSANFGSPVEYLNRNYGFVLVTDLNGDRKPDIALADTTGEFFNFVSVLLNTSNFQPGSPWLLTQEHTTRAVALDSVTFQRDPFRVCGTHNFSTDNLTRVMLFSSDDIDAMTGGDISVVSARAEDSQGRIYPLTVEHVGKVANSPIVQVVVKLADSIKLEDKVWLTISVRGMTSNRVMLKIDPSDCAPVSLPAPSWDAGRVISSFGIRRSLTNTT